jgi:hypothetical protein
MISLVFIVANDIAEIASSAYKPEGRRWPPSFKNASSKESLSFSFIEARDNTGV